MNTRLLLSALFSLLLAVPAVAQIGAATKSTSGADPRIRKALDQLGYKYTVDPDDDYKLTLEVGDAGRTQLLFINSETNSFGNIEVREIWSYCYYSEEEPSRSLCMKLLRDNNSKKFGAWEVAYSANSQKYAAAFNVKVAPDIDNAALKTAIQMAIEAADEMEQQISDDDNY